MYKEIFSSQLKVFAAEKYQTLIYLEKQSVASNGLTNRLFSPAFEVIVQFGTNKLSK